MTGLILWVLCGVASSIVASQKGYDPLAWFFLGVILGPIGLVIILVLSKKGAASNEKKCPHCAEFIKKEALVCKHCGRDLQEEFQFDQKPPQQCPRCGNYSFDGWECRSCKYSKYNAETAYKSGALWGRSDKP